VFSDYGTTNVKHPWNVNLRLPLDKELIMAPSYSDYGEQTFVKLGSETVML